jgi:hypothetical protein
MDSQIDTPFAQSMFYLCDKNPIAPNVCQGYICNTVSLGMNLLNRDLKIIPLLTQPLNY